MLSAVPAWVPVGLVLAARVAPSVTGRLLAVCRPSELGLSGWSRGRLNSGSVGGSLVTGHHRRALQAKCPRAAGTGLAHHIAGLVSA